MKSIILSLLIALSTVVNAASIEDYIDISKCDQIIDKQLYKICYSYKFKSALGGWVKLDGSKINEVNIKKRPRFYGEKTLPAKYRTKYKDYTGYGKNWNRGHFIVADADFDYDKKALNKAYTMANIIPQSAIMNQKTWTKVEKYGRALAHKLGYINSISIAEYKNPDNKIGNNIVIPSTLYRVYFNNDAGFEECFKYENILNVDYKNDKLKNHLIDCNLIMKEGKLEIEKNKIENEIIAFLNSLSQTEKEKIQNDIKKLIQNDYNFPCKSLKKIQDKEVSEKNAIQWFCLQSKYFDVRSKQLFPYMFLEKAEQEENNKKNKVINLEINSTKEITLNQKRVVLISFDINNIIAVYEKDKVVNTKKILNHRIKSKNEDYDMEQLVGNKDEYLKALDSLKPVIEINIHELNKVIQ